MDWGTWRRKSPNAVSQKAEDLLRADDPTKCARLKPCVVAARFVAARSVAATPREDLDERFVVELLVWPEPATVPPADPATPLVNDRFHLLASPATFDGDWTAKMWIEVTRTPLHIGDLTVLYASTDADAAAEFQVKCTGLVGLGGADLLP